MGIRRRFDPDEFPDAPQPEPPPPPPPPPKRTPKKKKGRSNVSAAGSPVLSGGRFDEDYDYDDGGPAWGGGIPSFGRAASVSLLTFSGWFSGGSIASVIDDDEAEAVSTTVVKTPWWKRMMKR